MPTGKTTSPPTTGCARTARRIDTGTARSLHRFATCCCHNRGVTLSALLVQFLNGLAGASSLFLVSAGLSLIFGVTRIVNFAHGSLVMLGGVGGGSVFAGVWWT